MRVGAISIEINEAALDTHIVLSKEGWILLEVIKTEIKNKLEAEFAIAYSTLEFEHPDDAHANAARYGHGRRG